MAASGIPVQRPNKMASDPSKAAAYYPPPPHPAFVQPPPPHPTIVQGEFSTGLCDCCSDCANCCITCWCPCITFGRIAEIVDGGQTSCCASAFLYALLMTIGCQCIYACTYRAKLKLQYGMEAGSCADCCADCCVHFWCETCSLCQEYRELEYRGFDPALGWHGNMQKRNQGITMAAPAAPVGMMR